MGYRCKHIFAVEYKLSRTVREVAVDGTIRTTTETLTIKTTAERKTYPQKWPEYNAAQCNERGHFHEFLADLCSTLPDTPKASPRGGRPAIGPRDNLFAAVLKVFSEKSARRFNGELEDAHEQGYISRMPHFNSVLNVFDKPETTGFLKGMIETSSLPLKAVESNFAVDSTGTTQTLTINGSRITSLLRPRRYSANLLKKPCVTGVMSVVVTAVDIGGQGCE